MIQTKILAPHKAWTVTIALKCEHICNNKFSVHNICTPRPTPLTTTKTIRSDL